MTRKDRNPLAQIAPETVREVAQELGDTFNRGLRDLIHTEAAAAMVGVLHDKSPQDAAAEEMQTVFDTYQDCIDPHLRNEAVRAGVCAAITRLDALGIFPHVLTKEIVGAFHALNDGEVKRIAVESRAHRRGSGTEYDRTALWIASECRILRATVPDARSDAAALRLLTGIARTAGEKQIPKDWQLAPMPRGTGSSWLEKLRLRGDDLLNARGGAGLRDVMEAIAAIKKGEPCPVDGFGELRAQMQAVFADRAARTAWLNKINSAVGRKRRLGTQPNAPLVDD